MNERPDYIVEWNNDASEAQPWDYVKCYRRDVGRVAAGAAQKYGKEKVHIYRIVEESFDFFPPRVEILAK